MGLIEAENVECIMMDATSVPDGQGGFIKQYVDGAKFKANIQINQSIQARIGMQQGVKNVYTVYMAKSIMLDKFDVFRRAEDGKIFRVTSDGTDKKTPKSAALNLRAVTAEEFFIGENS